MPYPRLYGLGVASNRLKDIAATDPNFSDVSLLIDFDGAVGNGSFTDSSNDARTVTTLGGVVRAADSVSWGHGAGADFTNSANERVEVADDPDWVNDDALTFEVRCKFDSVAAGGNFRNIFGQGAGLTSDDAWSLFTSPSGGLELFIGTSASTNLQLVGPTLAINTEYEIAFTRNTDGDYHLYVDGVVQASTATSLATFNSTSNFALGGAATGAAVLTIDGRLFEARWTRGVDRYGGSDYTPLTGKFPKS